ncbi:MAG: hypothetical protein ACOCQN_04270, partial [Halanaerobiaceae bacterium]
MPLQGQVFNKHLTCYIKNRSGLIAKDHKLSSEELILAGKLSLKEENNNPDYWQGIKSFGRKALFGDYIETVLAFLASPVEYIENLPRPGKSILYNLLGQQMEISPETDADPGVVANDFARTIFADLANNRNGTESIYEDWLDSHRYRNYLKSYLEDYSLPEDIDYWQVNPNHPFARLDEIWLEELSELILNNEECPEYMLTA